MNMFHAVKNFVKSKYQIADEELEQFENRLSLRKLEKGDFLIKKNQICDFIAFLNKGSLRHFSFLGEKEITLHFFIENEWVIDNQSFIAQQPSQNFIQAYEDSEIAFLGIHDLHQLIYRYPSFLRLAKIMDQNFNNRVRFDMDKSPDSRYKDLLEIHPMWVQRFAQKHIASYLGVTPETLSRVRARVK